MEISLLIESVGFGGAGVGRMPDGRVCFVPFTLPGERALVRVVKEKKSFVEAELVRLTEASTGRVPPRCAVFGKCGGCAYQHAQYERQLEIKTGQVKELLRRVGGIEAADVRPMLASPEQWGYRNRISVHVEEGNVGFFGRKSHRIVPASNCPIATEGVNAQLEALAGNPPRDDQRLTLREKTDFQGFSQVNPHAAEILASAVSEMLGGGEMLVDAYCGAGFFCKRLTSRFEKTIGIEWSAGAVRAARENAGDKETYLAGAVELHLSTALGSAAATATSLLVDPPAEGLSDEVIGQIIKHRPRNFVYVSCDPPTFSRDIKKLQNWYAIDYIQPVDMFPQTAEIELAAKLTHL